MNPMMTRIAIPVPKSGPRLRTVTRVNRAILFPFMAWVVAHMSRRAAHADRDMNPAMMASRRMT